MQRQMFAKGGAAFPDMNNDGTITQADILMGRGVQFKQDGGAIDSQPSFDARDPANKALFLQQNPEMSSSDYNQIFGIEEAPSDIFDPNDPANKARFLIENEGMTSEDYDKIFGVSNMAEGGIAGMMPPEMAPPGDMMSQEVVDPAVVEGLLAEAQANVENLDEADDYETVMNSIRGDDATLEERYMELADVVGEEDAAQTPESVLTLVQPAMAMAAVDQGIGGLAQEEMTAPVEGAMAEGIMSTVAPPPEPAMMAAPPMPPAGMGGPPPVNFKDGGLVRRGDNQPVQMFDNGGEAVLPGTLQSGFSLPVNDLIRQNTLRNIDAAQEAAANRSLYSPEVASLLPPITSKRGDGERLRELVEAQRGLYREYGLGDPEARAADLEEQKNMTQAQMLFDIANTALAFAAPMEGERRGMSPAERLAMAARTTQLPQTIGARAQQQLEYKRAAEKEGRTMDLAALQSAETKLAAEVAAEDALAVARAKPKTAKFINVLDKNGTKSLGSFDVSTTAGRAAAEKLLAENEGSFSTTNMPREPKDKDVVLYDNKTGAQSPIFNKNSEEGQAAMAAWKKDNPLEDGAYLELKPPTAPTPKGPITEKDFFDKFGFTFASFGELSPDMQNYVRGLPVITDKDYFAKYGVTKAEFSELDQNTQKFMMGLPVLTDKDYFSKYGINKEEFMALPTETKNRLARVAPDRKTVVVDGQIIDITEGKTPVAIFGDKNVKTITLDGEVLNITDPTNVTVMYGDKTRDIRIVKGQLVEVKGDGKPVAIFGERTPDSGTFENMILSDGSNILTKKVGETLYDTNGEIIDLALPKYEGAVLVSKDRAFADVKLARSQAAAGKELAAVNQEIGDSAVANQISGADTILEMPAGTNASRRVFDALGAARKGVGFYAKLKQVFSETAGAVIPALQNVAQDEVEAGNFIDSVNILGRVALANSPRIAEGEQLRLARMFPSTDNFFANPENAVRKLVGLKRLMREEYRQNLITLKTSNDATIRRQAEQQNHSVRGVLKLLETIPDRGFVSDTDFDETISGLESMRSQRVGQ